MLVQPVLVFDLHRHGYGVWANNFWTFDNATSGAYRIQGGGV